MVKEDKYNIFAKLRANVEDYYHYGIWLVGKPSIKDQFTTSQEYSKGRDRGYWYSQRHTLEAIDLACASKYKTGETDSEGKRKTFLNIVNFHADVSINQVDVNVSNYILEPTDDDQSWPVFFMDKKFKEWSDENSYDDIIDELIDEYVRRGSCVVKKIKKGVERVPLRTLRNSIRAKTLKDAAFNGGYVIIENEMSYGKMAKYKKWNLTGLKRDKTYSVFERYSLIPRPILDKFRMKNVKEYEVGLDTEEWEDLVCCQQILIPNIDSYVAENKNDPQGGHIVFIEEVDEEDFPMEEAHYRKIDGRWLGEGEVEKQLENQISRNFTANMRRRSLLWAAKKLFQSTDDDIAKNLLMEVKDGDVLKIKQNGQLTQVNAQSSHLADYQADENSVKENSQQISFSFEAASGEAMPSGTPFRLGAILENAVSKYFKRKQDTFANFLKRSFFDQLLPIFQQEMKEEHSLRYSVADEQYEDALAGMVQVHANNILKTEWQRGNFVSTDIAKQRVEEELRKSPYLFWEIPDSYYKNIHAHVRLNINEPVAADIETLTTVWQTMMQRNDPRADRVLKQILAKKGQNLNAIAGSLPKNPASQVVNGALNGTKNVPNKSVPVNGEGAPVAAQ